MDENLFAFDVFLSHSAKDKDTVREVAERLRMDGLRVWFDEWEISSVTISRRRSRKDSNAPVCCALVSMERHRNDGKEEANPDTLKIERVFNLR